MSEQPALSAVLVTGSQRERSQRALNALYAQTIAASIEIIVVDLAGESVPALHTSERARTTYLVRPHEESWMRARVHGVMSASTPVVAFIEEHCIPSAGWAEALVEAHRGPWAVVGYAFTNANPDSYLSRSGFMADYGMWAHPVPSGGIKMLPGNNVSYKRHLLLEYGDQLGLLLASDFNLHVSLNLRGGEMYLEGRALTAHENFSRLAGLFQSNYSYTRLMAANRMEAHSWSLLHRVVYVLGVPLGAPLIRLFRLIHGMRGRSPLWKDLLLALPMVFLVYSWAAVGEMLGYLAGPGTSEREISIWEFEAARSQRSEL